MTKTKTYLDINSLHYFQNSLEKKQNEFMQLIVIKFSGRNFCFDDLKNLYYKIENNISIDYTTDNEGERNIIEEIYNDEHKDNTDKNDQLIDVNKKNCIAWIYKNGEYLQCTRSKTETSDDIDIDSSKCYCGLHNNQIKKNGKLKYGNIYSNCPEKKKTKQRGRPKKKSVDNLFV